MTLNQIIKRIQTITLAHRQVRTFATRATDNTDSNHTTKYPVATLFDTGGSLSIGRKELAITYKLQLLDLVHASQDALDNEQDVMSDMVSVAIDIVSELNNPNYSDWKIAVDGSINFVVDTNGDRAAGVEIDFTVTSIYRQNRCEVPTETISFQTTDQSEKMVYDKIYEASGTEGLILTIPELLGKKIIFITREFATIFKVSNDPDTTEYTWNDTIITLGLAANSGERFLILYRNY